MPIFCYEYFNMQKMIVTSLFVLVCSVCCCISIWHQQPPLPIFFLRFYMMLGSSSLYLASNLQPPAPVDCYLPLDHKIFCLLRLYVCSSLSPLQCFDCVVICWGVLEEVALPSSLRSRRADGNNKPLLKEY